MRYIDFLYDLFQLILSVLRFLKHSKCQSGNLFIEKKLGLGLKFDINLNRLLYRSDICPFSQIFGLKSV